MPQPQPQQPAPARSPLVIGEVLFDHFPDESRVLGGAPFNVAWNLQGLGLAPTFLSCVGKDDEGDEVLDQMRQWGMATEGVQVSTDHSTGQVQVTIADGQPSYQILDDQAFDAIDRPGFAVSDQTHSLIYTGSLALRHDANRDTTLKLMQTTGLPCFLDVNIRQPWFDVQWAGQLIAGAKWVKLSEDELAYLSDQSWSHEEPSESEISQAVQVVRNRFAKDTPTGAYFVTLGHRGACAVTGDGAFWSVKPTNPPGGIQDTVGAGDAFVAATIYGLVHDWALDKTLPFASRFAANACTLKGATTNDKQHYVKFVQ
ncbi:carbohydrate kinase family protein [Planctomycetes bacterium K23_9]|uniref:Aminoimidazole riboside kinase n=1 Tax=Stieleria marina TaxID=1930275 RepID=A0A517NW74_9BACT|nr:aminoimidazole riboside kinase [Planctomycetes bacterium K23_9]